MTTLNTLFKTIEARRNAEPSSSHTAKLLSKGPAKCAEKFGEEAVEAIVACATDDRENLVYEAGDVVYHLMVMLAARGIDWSEVEGELARRAGISGIAEKASRTTQ